MSIGGYAGEFSTGNINVAVGYQALKGVDTGTVISNSVAVGNQAGLVCDSCTDNVLLGYRSGYSLASGDGNIFIGHKSGYNQTALSNLLIIDNQDRGSVGNELVESLLYGVFHGTATSQTLTVNGTFKVGNSTNIQASKFGDGGATTYANISNTGDLSFVGTAEFHPPRVSQSAQPTPSVGELQIWRDPDDNKTYLIYKTAVNIR